MSGPDPELLGAVLAAANGLLAVTAQRPVVIGICGAQGSGKSTLVEALADRLSGQGHPTAVLSIDDIYLTKQERQNLARDVHPLLATRGPPGTHDVSLGLSVISDLRARKPCRLPRFDKAQDDRKPESEWPFAPSSCDVLILEGWCVGAIPQPEQALLEPVNDLERLEDPQRVWRTFVNDALARPYQDLFGKMDYLIFLQAPSFNVVLEWRTQQEEQLRAKSAYPAAGIMNREQISRFIQHYERITRHLLGEMGQRADMHVMLDGNRHPVQISMRDV